MTKSSKSPNRNVIIGALSFVVMVALVSAFIIFSPVQVRDPLCSTVTAVKPLLCRDIISVHSIQVNQDSMHIGLSEGGFPFDIYNTNGSDEYK